MEERTALWNDVLVGLVAKEGGVGGGTENADSEKWAAAEPARFANLFIAISRRSFAVNERVFFYFLFFNFLGILSFSQGFLKKRGFPKPRK